MQTHATTRVLHEILISGLLAVGDHRLDIGPQKQLRDRYRVIGVYRGALPILDNKRLEWYEAVSLLRFQDTTVLEIRKDTGDIFIVKIPHPKCQEIIWRDDEKSYPQSSKGSLFSKILQSQLWPLLGQATIWLQGWTVCGQRNLDHWRILSIPSSVYHPLRVFFDNLFVLITDFCMVETNWSYIHVSGASAILQVNHTVDL